MQRLVLLGACLVGSTVAGIVGLFSAIWWDTSLVALIGAAIFPTVCLVVAGLQSRSQLFKIAGYALIGWTLCFILAPTTSQRPQNRASRIAADPLVGKGWYIPCAVVSWVMASVGVAFSPLNGLSKHESMEDPATSDRNCHSAD
jgi:hypothetical protein